MKHSLPWESVPPPIYPAQSSLKPRKKWVQTGGWILVVVLLLFGISTRSRNPLLAFVSLAFSVLYLLTLMTKKDAALTSRGLEIFYDMQFGAPSTHGHARKVRGTLRHVSCTWAVRATGHADRVTPEL